MWKPRYSVCPISDPWQLIFEKDGMADAIRIIVVLVITQHDYIACLLQSLGDSDWQ